MYCDMNKALLRTAFLDKRRKLSADEYARLNLQLYHHFFAGIDLSFVKVLHTYLPIARNHEPDTWQMLDRIRREFPNVRLSIPRMTNDGNLENFYFEGLHQVETNKLGIPEPKQGVPTPSERIDMVIVPLIAFDKRGHRIGYGKGYYDRFLATCRYGTIKVGLSLFGPVEQIDDTDDHDIQLNMAVTPEGVIRF